MVFEAGKRYRDLKKWIKSRGNMLLLIHTIVYLSAFLGTTLAFGYRKLELNGSMTGATAKCGSV